MLTNDSGIGSKRTVPLSYLEISVSIVLWTRLWSSGVESRLVRKIVRVRIIASRNRRYALGKGIKDKMLNCTNPAVVLQDDRGDSILP